MAVFALPGKPGGVAILILSTGHSPLPKSLVARPGNRADQREGLQRSVSRRPASPWCRSLPPPLRRPPLTCVGQSETFCHSWVRQFGTLQRRSTGTPATDHKVLCERSDTTRSCVSVARGLGHFVSLRLRSALRLGPGPRVTPSAQRRPRSRSRCPQ